MRHDDDAVSGEVWICATCGIEHAPGSAPPSECVICRDDRQYLPAGGQRWTTRSELSGRHAATLSELEPDLHAVGVEPKFGIGQRPLLVRTPAGNLLWEPSGYVDDDLIEAVTGLGGVAAVAASHPHLVGSAVTWARRFGGVPFWFNRADARWLRRPDPVVEFWDDTTEVLPGLTLRRCGGHFPGSAVAHWSAGAEGRGALLTGDTLYVGSDRQTVSFMRSYPNLIPLPERLVRQIVGVVDGLEFDRLYAGFDGQVIGAGAKAAVQFSADRYLGWLRDEIRDPDEVFP